MYNAHHRISVSFRAKFCALYTGNYGNANGKLDVLYKKIFLMCQWWNTEHHCIFSVKIHPVERNSPGPRMVNVVLSVKVFFSTVSCSLGVAHQDSGGCQVASLEHFQIFTIFQNGRHRNRGKSNFWTRPARNLCDTSFKSNLTTRNPILTLFLHHDLILTPKVKMAAIRLTKILLKSGKI